MLNRIHGWLHRPENGWDPVPEEHARYYAEAQWQIFEEARELAAQLDARVRGLQGKTVLDLGGGPGHYSVAFAQRGARVTWHDISRRYQDVVQARAKENGVSVTCSLGYLEQAEKFVAQPFDLVFNRGCWFYCLSDRAFAKLIYSLAKPGGAGYVESNTPAFDRVEGRRKWQYFINEHFYYKIGHPHPPHGRIAALLRRCPLDQMSTDYASPLIDKVFFLKSKKR